MHTRSFLRSSRRLFLTAVMVGSLLAAPSALLAQTRGAEPSDVTVRRAVPVAAPAVATGDRATGAPAAEAARAEPVTSISMASSMPGLNDKRPIGIGDRLSVSIVEDELPPRPVGVTDSGEIEAPWIGRVTVGNRTCKQLAYYLKGLLEKELYHQATVLVSLDSASGRTVSRGRVYIYGSVMRPGPLELPAGERITVSKAIMQAGGFNQYADKKKVKLMRGGANYDKKDTILCNMVDVLEKGITRNDFELQPEDVVMVEEKWLNF